MVPDDTTSVVISAPSASPQITWRIPGVRPRETSFVFSRQWSIGLVVIGAMLFELTIAGVGIVKSLPYEPEADESVFVEAAAHIARTGDLNPHWFGHPGATVIYPLALALRVAYGGGLHAHVAGNLSDFYLLGRWLSVAYAVLSLPLVFVIGRRVFGTVAGLVGMCIMSILPIAVSHAQVVRTDSAGVFFGLLAVWLCLRMGDAPHIWRVALAGVAVGVAIATRYFMVALVPLLLGTIRLRRHVSTRELVGMLAPPAVALALGFALTSPFVLLDPAELQKSLLVEAKTTTPGADGLTPVGNFAWYLTSALPADLTWPIAGMTLIGVVLALRTSDVQRALLVSYVAVYLVVISAPALHWHRWIIQVLPVLALFCGYTVQVLAMHAPARRIACLGMSALLLVQPGYQLVAYDFQQTGTPPRIRAREWIVSNLPKGTRVAVEGYGPPLAGLGYADTEMFTLAEPGGADDYAARGYRYLAVSSAVYDRYFSEPQRYAPQVTFYTDLFQRGHLVAEIDSPVPAPDLFALIAGAECNCALHPTRGGPKIRIYAI